MSNLTIYKYPSKALRVKCMDIKGVSASEKKLMQEMLEVMHEACGIGLAAPQVGISTNIIIVETDEGLLNMANPKIMSTEGASFLEEGCLSVPEKCVNVKRPEGITVSYIDENDKRCEKVFKALTARVIQHEIDHLNGKLIIDYLPWYRKIIGKGGAICRL